MSKPKASKEGIGAGKSYRPHKRTKSPGTRPGGYQPRKQSWR
jgi:hypothetical protein